MTNSISLQAKPAKVLVIDDDPTTLEMLGLALRQAGHEPLLIDDPLIAEDHASNFEPDIVICDLRMPRMSGFEVCRRIKQLPGGSTVPVIFISGTEQQTDVIKALEVGGADFIRKPFQLEEVLLRVRNQIKLRRGQARLEQIYRDQKTFFLLLTRDLRDRLQRPSHLKETLRREMQGMSDHKTTSILVGIEAELNRLRRHLDDLVTWGRFQLGDEMGQPTRALAAFEIDDVIRQLRSTRTARQQTLLNRCNSSAEVYANPHVFQQGMRMLVEATLRISPVNASIEISCRENEQGCDFSIVSSGLALTEDETHQLLVFDRLLESRQPPEFGFVLGSGLIERDGGRVRIETGEDGRPQLRVFFPSA